MELDLIELDFEVVDIVHNHMKSNVRHCARNAIHHLEKAWDIHEIDYEMTLFRAITAEEEVARAIFLALKEKHYENAKKIKDQQHVYKQGLYPFMDAVSRFLHKTSQMEGFPFGPNYNLSVANEGGKKGLRLHLEIQDGRWVTPIPPLHFSISMNNETYLFDDELEEIASEHNKNAMREYIKDTAGLRNHMIYASDKGVPHFEGDISKILLGRQKKIFTMLRVLCLMYPYKEKALFVQQVLNAFLYMMGDIENSVNI